MRAILLSALLLASLVSRATAQIVVGPVAIQNEVNGIPITVNATSWITVNSDGNELSVDARIFADFIDLQKKFATILGTFKLPADSCANRGADNQSPVVALKSGTLWPRDDQLVMSIRGQIDVWSCVTGPLRSEIRWKKKKIAFVKLSIPQLYTWTNLIKNKDGTHLFHGSLPIYLAEKDATTVAVKVAGPNIIMDRQEASVTGASLKLAKLDINQKASAALQSAIDPAKLKEALPSELQKLNMAVVSARFRDQGGHAVAEVNLAARVSGESIPELLQQVAASPPRRGNKPDTVLFTLR
jgi:hypothetical protein